MKAHTTTILRASAMLTMLLTMAGCITINIYFPAAAAEKAADKVIDEIWQTLPDGTQPPPDKAVSPAALPADQPAGAKP